jgi:hypothetical protein
LNGEYIVYVDESGDHGLRNIDPHYPVFVLAFCIFRIEDYVEQVVPALQRFKFREFGHDAVILHERDIRKDQGPFSGLKSKARKEQFLGGLSEIIERAPFRVVSSVIHKEKLQERYRRETPNPYDIALSFGLERIHYHLCRNAQRDCRTHVVFERRGKNEDRDLELEFRRVCSGQNYPGEVFDLELQIADKKTNSTGLQLADLIARPIGLSILRPDQPNRAFEVIRQKFDCNPEGKIEGWGLKCFP